MVEIKEVKTRRERIEFIRFPKSIYSDCPYWTPDLVFDELENLTPEKNTAFGFCEARFFMAYRDGKAVGRIGAILSHRANEKWNQKRMRFTRVDFIDDDEVVDALFGAVVAWAKEKGCDELHGPMGFTDLDKEGMLIDGFEEQNLFITICNYPYYVRQMERLGFAKSVDWVEYQVTVPEQMPERLDRLAEVVLKRNHLKVFDWHSKKELRPKIKGIFQLINEAYGGLYGVVELEEHEIDHYVDQYLPLVQHDLVSIVLDEEDKVCAFGLLMPSLGPAVKKADGKLFPFGWAHLLKGLKNYEVLDMYLVAVRPSLQNHGVNAIVLHEILKNAYKHGVKFAETDPQLEMNEKIQMMFKSFDRRQHRRRRCWIKSI